jgi:hypothetical protein
MKKQSVLLIVLAVLMAVVFLQRRQQNQLVATEPAGSVSLHPDRVSRLRIDRPGEPTVELARIGGGWRLSVPFDYAAQDPAVQSTLTSLQDLELVDVVSSNPEKRHNYDVDSSGTHVQAWEGDKQVLSLIIGKAAPDFAHTFVRRDGSDEVYRAVGMLSYTFNKKANDWRDKTILALHLEEVGRVALRYPKDNLSVQLTRQDSLWTVATNGGASAIADSATVANLLSAVAHFNSVSFATPEDLQGHDLSQADFELYLETDSGQHELHFWKAENSRYFVRRKDADDVVFSVYENSLSRVLKKPEDFKPASS